MIANTLPKSLLNNPRLNSWIRFEPDGTVRIATGKVELGQGVLTALGQMAAEELDVDPARITMLSGTTDEAPDEGYTAGSRSIEESGASIRLVCAEVRMLVLERAATRLCCDIHELSIEDGVMLRAGTATGLDYWSLRDEIDLDRCATGAASLKRAADFRVIGRNVARLDLRAKLSGGAFIHDWTPDNLIHGRVVRAPHGYGPLLSLDEGALRHALSTRAGSGADFIRDHDFLAVVAPDETAATRAAEVARRYCVWADEQPIPREAGEQAFLMRQASRDRIVETGSPPDPEAIAREAQATYSRPYIAHASIAPSCALAQFADGQLTVWTHSQGVFLLREALSQVLRMAPRDIQVRHRPGAGCYGHNGADDVALDAALIARRVPGRCIRVQWSREDEMSVAPFGSAMTARLRASLDAAGRPLGVTHEVWSGVHGQRPGMHGAINLLAARSLASPLPKVEPADPPDEVGAGGMRNAVPLYDFPFLRLIHHLLPALPVRTSSLRGLGAFLNIFAIESFIDELAEQVGADPLSYRLSMLTEKRARAVIETVAEMADFAHRGEPGSGRGKGLAFARYKNRAGYCAIVAEVEVSEIVRLVRVWCAVDGGLIINPDGALNQIEGGIIQSASWTLKEAVRFEDGRVTSINWENYPILRFSEIPDITVRLIKADQEPALGLGEVAMGPTAAAIGNAVASALGARIRDLPLNRERILSALLADEGAQATG